MVKILMAHGFGVNASIFEAQTAPIRAQLPSHWEYHFVQGPLECGPAQGISEIYPGQTYNCWFFVPSLAEFQSVHDFLEEVIEDEGPFDAAWGFSAGAMVIASLMLRHAHERPHLPGPFRAAIFQNSTIPWSAIPALGLDVTPLVIQHVYVPPTLPLALTALAAEKARNPTKEAMLADDRNANWEDGELIPPMMRFAYQRIHQQVVDNGIERPYSDYEAHRMFAEVDQVRLGVPTGHILAEHDPVKELGEALVEMCDPKVRLCHENKGFAHEVPYRSARDMKKIAEVVEKTIRRSEFA